MPMTADGVSDGRGCWRRVASEEHVERQPAAVGAAGAGGQAHSAAAVGSHPPLPHRRLTCCSRRARRLRRPLGRGHPPPRLASRGGGGGSAVAVAQFAATRRRCRDHGAARDRPRGMGADSRCSEALCDVIWENDGGGRTGGERGGRGHAGPPSALHLAMRAGCHRRLHTGSPIRAGGWSDGGPRRRGYFCRTVLDGVRWHPIGCAQPSWRSKSASSPPRRIAATAHRQPPPPPPRTGCATGAADIMHGRAISRGLLRLPR